MRPRSAAAAFNSSEYVFELKWDGLRALASRDDGVVHVTDRNGGDLLPLIPEFAKRNYHSTLPHIDFVKAAEAHGWEAVRIAPDLSNLRDVMDAAYERRGRSLLVDLPVDADQILGLNPRLHNLTTKTYL